MKQAITKLIPATVQIALIKKWYSLQRFVKKIASWLPIKHIGFAGLAGIAVVLAVVGVTFFTNSSLAQLVTLDREDILGGTVNFNDVQINEANQISLQRGDIGDWENGHGYSTPPTMFYPSTTSGTIGPDKAQYYMASAQGCHFYRYNNDPGGYEFLKKPPVGCGRGSYLAFDGNQTIYFLPANDSNAFFKYDVASGEWVRLADLISPAGYGASITYTGGSSPSIFALRGNSSASFWRYDIATDAWESKALFTATNSLQYGTHMTWDESGSIYAISNNYREFRRYSIIGDTWTTLPSPNEGCTRNKLLWVNTELYNVQVDWCRDITYVKTFSPLTETWTDKTQGPTAYYWWQPEPLAMYDGDDSIIALLGPTSQTVFYTYTISTDSWEDAPFLSDPSNIWHWKPMYDGAQSVYYFADSCWSCMRTLYKYDLVTKDSSPISSQLNANTGMNGVYYNNSLYLLDYIGGTEFYKFDLNSNTFIKLPDAPYTTHYGASAVDGGDGYLYITFGAKANFYRYSDAGGWEALSSSPRISYTGSQITRVGGFLYLQSGGNQSPFMKYEIATDTWTTLIDTPTGAVQHGGTMASDGSRYLYSVRATRTHPHNTYMYRFDTTDDSWSRVADLPTDTNVSAGSFYDTSNDRLFIAPGMNTGHIYSWVPTTNSFVTEGDWYSEEMDLTQVENWNSLNYTVTGSGTVTMYTRTSDNSNLWSDWQAVTGTIINSTPKRYIQLKASLSGSGTDTPILQDINIDFNQETLPPSLPSQLMAYDEPGGTQLSSGIAYEYQHPYFEWDGSSDGLTGSGIEGYYVYFGVDSGADPEIDGSFQTDTNYTVTQSMTSDDINFLRIKVKDNLGNVSSAATYFSYRYFYISPPAAITNSTKADFLLGANVNVDVTDSDEMKLRAQADGAWSIGQVEQLPDNPYGAAATVVGDDLYILRGSNSSTFWRYNTVTQVWNNFADLPDIATLGSTMTWDGGDYIYAARGDDSSSFYRYNIPTDIWETLPDLPAISQDGTDIVHLGGDQIGILFSGVAEFYTYNTTTEQYSNQASPPLAPHNSFAASGIWYDGDNTIYAFLGSSPSAMGFGRKAMVKYTISEDSWRNLSTPPFLPVYTENNLVSDGQGSLYIFGSDNTYSNDDKSMGSRYDIANDTWESLPDYHGINFRGTTTSDGERYIYIIPADGFNRKIIQYDTWDERFTPLDTVITSWDRIPWDASSGYLWRAGQATTAAYDGKDDVYVIGGNESDWSRFMKRSISTGEVEYLPIPPYIAIGGSLEFMDDRLYYLPARNRNDFYRFDFNTKTWLELPAFPANVYRPGTNNLIKVGSELFASRGNNPAYYKFTPSGEVGGAWTQVASAPGNIEASGTLYDGSDIYVLAGDNTNRFYKYDPVGDAWTTLANFPATVTYGASIVHSDGRIYAGSGNTTDAMYVYDIATDTWATSGTNSVATFRWGATFIPIDNDHALFIGGQDSPNIWRFNFPKADQAYRGLATHESQIMQIDGLFDHAGITANVDLPENTKVEFWTRTSEDTVTWSDWEITNQVKIFDSKMQMNVVSAAETFIQVKSILYSYDNKFTPTVNDYSLEYYFDVDPPNNPGLVDVYSDDSKTTAISSSTWYNHDAIHIDWPEPGEAGGAADGLLGSRVRGYWVYLGTDPSATPQTAGTFVTDTHYTADLDYSETYYLRIQAEDMTGNVAIDTFAPYVYKFDNTPPNKPAFITVTPAGFTSINNFTFEWPNAFDGDSGIDKYCYRTGALSGPYAVENCQDDLILIDVDTAYQSGTNVFYVRTLDFAGNYSSSDTEVSFYYSTDPPGPVTNLQPIPPQSTQNLFAFTWDLPVVFSGDPNALEYCYSVNILPSDLNTTCTGNRFIVPIKAATQEGTNVLYVVAKDEASQVNWNSYAQTIFIANTISPGFPLNLVSTDTSDQEAERWSIALTWDEPTFPGNGIDHYIIERSEDNHTFGEIGTTSSKGYVDLTVLPDIDYYYRVRASDEVDNFGSPSSVVLQNARGRFIDPPSIIVAPTAAVGFDQADVTWVTNRESTSFVEYGTSPANLDQSKGNLDEVTNHDVIVSGLEPSTRYYYRVQSFDIERNYDLVDAYSQIYSFTTTDTARIFNVASSDISLNSAILSWQTSIPTKAVIEYGEGLDYGFVETDEAGYTNSHTFKLNGLASGTTYHYRIISTTEFGSDLRSDDYTITTLPYPFISNIQFQPVIDAPTLSVLVTWDTNVPATSVVNYKALSAEQEVSSSDLTTKHEFIISDLAGSSEYEFTFEGRDQYGSLAISDKQTWRSQVDTREPVISDVAVDTTIIGAFNDSKAQMIVSWHTDEPATTSADYGEINDDAETTQTPLDPDPTTEHVVVISGVDLSKVYKIRPISTDINGNTSYGQEIVTVTPDQETSVLDTILNLLQRIF